MFKAVSTQVNSDPIRMCASYLDLVMVGLSRWWASNLAALGRAAGSGWTISRNRLFSSREYSLRYSSSPRCMREYTGSSRLFLFKEKGALPKKAEQNLIYLIRLYKPSFVKWHTSV